MKNCLTICLLLISCSLNAQFKEVSKEKGIDHLHAIPTLMGGGIAVIDYDMDGFEDLFFTGGTAPNRLYRNINGEYFIDVSRKTGIDVLDAYPTMGCVSGDINNDGYPELFVTTYSRNKNVLLLNEHGSFRDVSTEYGLEETPWSMSATLLDFNRDGFLDIYVANYVMLVAPITNSNGEIIGFNHQCHDDLLYMNQGGLGFENQAISLEKPGCGLAVTSIDYDLDLDPDLYAVNDFGQWVKPNFLLENTGNSLLEKHETGLEAAIYGMGVATGDLNLDGKPDFYLTNIGRNRLLMSSNDGEYYDATDEMGVADNLSTGWGTFFFDYNNDGLEDLFVANGYIPSAPFLEIPVLDPNALFTNTGNAFERSKSYQTEEEAWSARGAVYLDYDHDGDLDYVVSVVDYHQDSENHILFYENRSPGKDYWVELDLEGKHANRQGIGARVRLVAGELEMTRYVTSGESFASNHTKLIHFGLGKNKWIDSLIVTWGSGTVDRFTNVISNKFYRVMESGDRLLVMGCRDTNALNTNPDAEVSWGCTYDVYGCKDVSAMNYKPAALIDDNSCSYVTGGSDESDRKLMPYPNPAGDYLYFELKASERAYLVDGLGRKLQLKWKAPGVLDLDNILPGIYYLTIYSETEKEVFKSSGTLSRKRLIMAENTDQVFLPVGFQFLFFNEFLQFWSIVFQ